MNHGVHVKKLLLLALLAGTAWTTWGETNVVFTLRFGAVPYSIEQAAAERIKQSIESTYGLANTDVTFVRSPAPPPPSPPPPRPPPPPPPPSPPPLAETIPFRLEVQVSRQGDYDTYDLTLVQMNGTVDAAEQNFVTAVNDGPDNSGFRAGQTPFVQNGTYTLSEGLGVTTVPYLPYTPRTLVQALDTAYAGTPDLNATSFVSMRRLDRADCLPVDQPLYSGAAENVDDTFFNLQGTDAIVYAVQRPPSEQAALYASCHALSQSAPRLHIARISFPQTTAFTVSIFVEVTPYAAEVATDGSGTYQFDIDSSQGSVQLIASDVQAY